MRKLPRNPGLNKDGDTFSCISRQVESSVSIYVEVADGRLYLDVLGDQSATFSLNKTEAVRLLTGLQRLLPQVQS